MSAMVYGPDLQLPWSSTLGEDARFKKIAAVGLVVFLLCAIAVPWVEVPEIPREQQEALPDQLARVILEQQELPKPEPVQPKPVEKPPEVKPKEPEKPKEPPKEPPPKVEPEPRQVDLVKEAREQASVAGVLAFQDDLQEMRQSIDVEGVTRSNLNRGRAEAEKLERSIVTSNATSSSGGIQTSNLSRDTGGVALSGRETTRIESPAGQGGGTSAKASDPQQQQAGGRSDESIRRVMDDNKGVIFAIYNRALRKNPSLQGRFVFEMLIEPNGAVSEIRLLSSELGDSDLETKILTRIRLINFGSAQVVATKVNYSFDFLPY